MLSCKDVTRRASAYLDGDLGRWERLRLLAHLAICRGCRRYLDQLRITVALLPRLPSPLPDRATADRLSMLFSMASGAQQAKKDDAPL
jgi:anti-sigma factor RsiW